MERKLFANPLDVVENRATGIKEHLLQGVMDGKLPKDSLQIKELGWHMISVNPENVHSSCPSAVEISQRLRNFIYSFLGRTQVTCYMRLGIGLFFLHSISILIPVLEYSSKCCDVDKFTASFWENYSTLSKHNQSIGMPRTLGCYSCVDSSLIVNDGSVLGVDNVLAFR